MSSPDPMDETPPWDWNPAGLVRLKPLSVLSLQGPDTLRFLHGQSSQAMEGSKPGQRLSTCCISPTARMRALAEVLVDHDGAWLLIHGGDAEAVRTALDRVLFPADAVQLGPLQPAWLIQPLPLSATPASHWQPLKGEAGFWLGDQLVLLREEVPGADSAADLPHLEASALELLSRPRLEAEGLERLRLQLGEPASPGEINDDWNPFELGLAERVSLNKGCYVGQETLARLATYDGVRQQLRRWSCHSDGRTDEQATDLLKPGTRLETPEGERAGVISSAMRLGSSTTWIGLALVRRSALEQSTLRPEADPGATADSLSINGSLVLRMSRPTAFCDPPSGSGSSR